MAWLISVLGAALALAGAVALGNGVSYIRLDWGQTETVAGTVALSAGLVTVALGAVLFALRDIIRRPLRASSSGVGMEALTANDDDTPARPGLSRLTSKLATVGMPMIDPSEPAAMTGIMTPPHDLDAPQVADRPDLDTVPRMGIPTAAEIAPVPRDRLADEAPFPEPALIDAPTVVGRYEANGASYVLFSDGTIEVETESGTHRFASMADLRDHIARQEAI